MGRPSRLTPAIAAAIVARRAAGISYRELAAEHGVSVSVVQAALHGRPQRPVRPPSGQRGAPAAPDVADRDSGDADPADGDASDLPRLRRELGATVDRLARLSREASAGQDATALLSAVRALTPTIALLARLTPPVEVPPAELPDMIAAAEECRARLLAAVERARAGRGAL